MISMFVSKWQLAARLYMMLLKYNRSCVEIKPGGMDMRLIHEASHSDGKGLNYYAGAFSVPFIWYSGSRFATKWAFGKNWFSSYAYRNVPTPAFKLHI